MGKKYTEDEILNWIRDAPDIDYIGEYIIKKLKEDSTKP